MGGCIMKYAGNVAAFLALAGLAALMGCANGDTEETFGYELDDAVTLNLIDTAATDPQFDTFVSAVNRFGLTETLTRPGPFTVFAPTDAAFAKLPAATRDMLLADRDLFQSVLMYHIVPGRLGLDDVADVGYLDTVEGTILPIRSMNGTLVLGDAQVVEPNLEATNGVIHGIDTVLLPDMSVGPPRMQLP